MKIQNLVLLLAAVAVVSYAIFTLGSSVGKPSCSDGIQNQDETGVDCGGSCSPCIIQAKSCSELNTTDSRARCFFNEGITKRDASICDYIEMQFYKDACFGGIAKEINDSELCNKINSSLSVMECLRDVAISSLNPVVCSKIKDQSHRDTCYYRIASDTANMSTCLGIGSNPSMNTCLALLNKNSTYCDRINESNSRDWCYNKVASLSPEVKTCANIQSIQTKDLCYKLVAVKKINSDLCSIIHNKTLQADCLTEVADAKKRWDELQKSLGGNITVSPE